MRAFHVVRDRVFMASTPQIVTHAITVRVDRRTAARFLSWPLRFQRSNQKTSVQTRCNDRRICRFFPVSLEPRWRPFIVVFRSNVRRSAAVEVNDPPLFSIRYVVTRCRGIYKPYRVYHGPFVSLSSSPVYLTAVNCPAT